MKKLLCFLLVCLLIGSMAGCKSTTNTAGALVGDSQSAPKVKEMITALAENRNTDVKALMHPRIREQAADQVTLIDGAVVYLNVVYLSNNEGTGFASFQLVLSVV